MTDARPRKTPGAKMQYLIRRRPTTSRDELIAHWFANHMPSVIQRNSPDAASAANASLARRYVASLFDPEPDAPPGWDGVAQLWHDAAPPQPAAPHGDPPRDTFQELVEPYRPWATTEWVFVDGKLPLKPPTLNAAFPATRSGFLKQISLVPAKPGVDVQGLFDHWLDVHGPNVRDTMLEVGGFRYAVSLSLDPAASPYAGMAELYFPDRAAQDAFWSTLKPDGFQDWVDSARTLRYRCGTELVGIE